MFRFLKKLEYLENCFLRISRSNFCSNLITNNSRFLISFVKSSEKNHFIQNFFLNFQKIIWYKKGWHIFCICVLLEFLVSSYKNTCKIVQKNVPIFKQTVKKQVHLEKCFLRISRSNFCPNKITNNSRFLISCLKSSEKNHLVQKNFPIFKETVKKQVYLEKCFFAHFT